MATGKKQKSLNGNTSWHVAKSSGKWNNALKARIFNRNLNNSSSNRNRNISRQSVHALKSTHPVNTGWVFQ